jgi:hypothetical protein
VRALDGDHFPDEDHVVARAMSRVVAAFEPCDAAVDQRRVRPAEAKRHAREAVGMRAREPAREFHLRGGEHVDGIALGRVEYGEVRRALRDRPQHERRLERHRAERVGREPDVAIVRGARTDDRDAGRELRERIAELPLVERRHAFARVPAMA